MSAGDEDVFVTNRPTYWLLRNKLIVDANAKI